MVEEVMSICGFDMLRIYKRYGTVGRPMAIVAHSMGGLATLHTMMHSLTPKVNCVALSNPLLGLFMPPHPIKEQAGRLLSKVLPWLPLPNEVLPKISVEIRKL